uniref:NBS-LRR disease resistance protein NBS47 n=1 Tax=Dimocarpus longan TaxID=128017 RepID=A0A0F6RA54_9ROSI|nr:NBS-LRR disease resistance protein NBS47 [Dimocarpus longan]
MDFIFEALIGALLQAAIQCLLERLVPRNNFTEFFLGKLLPNRGNNKILFDNLKSALKLLEKALSDDAVEKQLTSQTNREWVERLTDAVNQTADLLDEIYSQVLAESQPIGESALHTIIQKSKGELEKMTKSLEDIAKLKDVHGSKESSSKKKSSRLESTSLVDESEVYGRDDDKKKIRNFLVEDKKKIQNFLVEQAHQRNRKDIPVIAIIGMAGIGKTTLAQLLFNDFDVKSKFGRRAWVHVSEDMDVWKVTKTLYEKVTDQTSDIQNLDTLQNKLFDKLQNEQNEPFLFVFDDVWNEHHHTWVELQKVLKSGAPESRIIVTTRSQEVASTMRANETHHLRPLNDKDCWLLFAKQAFGSPHTDPPPKLKPIAQDIVKKCGGFPLVARELGSLLYSKVDVEEWENILNDNLFDLSSNKIDILAWFRLSFNNLSSPFLKQCFAYCSIIPKGQPFDKEKLILLWMAQGFLLQLKAGRTMEEVGIKYFQELLTNSFFQRASDDDKSLFEMHDIINELAQFASTIQSCLVEKGKSPNISEKTRHVSYVCDGRDNEADLVDVLRKAEFLSTFLPSSLFSSCIRSSYIGTEVIKELKKQKRLRVLSLCYQNAKLPNEFGILPLLRYLDLSNSEIVELPETISKLYTLQTLILSHCMKLKKLPEKMADLIYLSHLDLTGTEALEKMPPAFGKLKNLRILTDFVVGYHLEASRELFNHPKASSIEELGKLSLLHGKLSILKLQNVRDDEDTEKAKLNEKKDVKEMEFKWNSNGQRDKEEVLEKLRPHEDIEKLSIAGFGGTRLPNWLGDLSFSKMVLLRLSDCRNCSFLPSLRQLSSLQRLHVTDMPNCEKWLSSPVTGGGYLSLPVSLQTLTIINCDKLTPQTTWGLRNLTSLTDLRIDCAYENVSIFPPDGLLPASLSHLQIVNFKVLKTLNLDGLRELDALKSLLINCKQLEILSGGILPDSLSHLNITGRPSLTHNCQGKYWNKISHIHVKIINGIDLP